MVEEVPREVPRQYSVGGKRVAMTVETASKENQSRAGISNPSSSQIYKPVTAPLRTSRSPTSVCHINREHELWDLRHSLV